MLTHFIWVLLTCQHNNFNSRSFLNLIRNIYRNDRKKEDFFIVFTNNVIKYFLVCILYNEHHITWYQNPSLLTGNWVQGRYEHISWHVKRAWYDNTHYTVAARWLDELVTTRIARPPGSWPVLTTQTHLKLGIGQLTSWQEMLSHSAIFILVVITWVCVSLKHREHL